MMYPFIEPRGDYGGPERYRSVDGSRDTQEVGGADRYVLIDGYLPWLFCAACGGGETVGVAQGAGCCFVEHGQGIGRQ